MHLPTSDEAPSVRWPRLREGATPRGRPLLDGCVHHGDFAVAPQRTRTTRRRRTTRCRCIGGGRRSGGRHGGPRRQRRLMQ